MFSANWWFFHQTRRSDLQTLPDPRGWTTPRLWHQKLPMSLTIRPRIPDLVPELLQSQSRQQSDQSMRKIPVPGLMLNPRYGIVQHLLFWSRGSLFGVTKDEVGTPPVFLHLGLYSWVTGLSCWKSWSNTSTCLVLSPAVVVAISASYCTPGSHQPALPLGYPTKTTSTSSRNTGPALSMENILQPFKDIAVRHAPYKKK